MGAMPTTSVGMAPNYSETETNSSTPSFGPTPTTGPPPTFFCMRFCNLELRGQLLSLYAQHRFQDCPANDFHLSKTFSSSMTTASFGIAQRQEEMDSPKQLLIQADQALYAAKKTGRNRVVSFGESIPEDRQAMKKPHQCPSDTTAATDMHPIPSLALSTT